MRTDVRVIDIITSTYDLKINMTKSRYATAFKLEAESSGLISTVSSTRTVTSLGQNMKPWTHHPKPLNCQISDPNGREVKTAICNFNF